MRHRLRWRDASPFSFARSGQLKFNDRQLASLTSQIVGRIVLPQDPSYSSDRQGFMSAFQHFPQIIVFCAGFSDVVACLRFAKEVGLHVVCRSGGHSVAGFSVNNGMVIDVSGISYVRVDQRRQVAAIGAGTEFGRVNAELDLFGLHLPGGGCETVCVAGYMQGGGYSFTSLMYGMNCDQVIGVQMARADGQIVTASADQNEDLFWAVRGGTGNNFGVLLEVQYTLRQLGPLWGFGFKWPLTTVRGMDAAIKAVTTWHEHFTGDRVPANLGHQALLVCTQDAHDKELAPYFVVRGLFNGSEADCRKALDPLFSLPHAETRRDIWRQGTYRDLNDYLLNFPTELPANVPASARALAKSHIVDRHLSADEWSRIVDLFRASPNSNNFIGLEAYGGAINRVAPDATAFWHRRSTTDMFLFAFWMYEDDRSGAETYLTDFDRVVAPLGSGHSYQNYPNRDQLDFGRRYFGGNLERLMQVKKQYDPDDLFSFPQGLLFASPNVWGAEVI
jgi:FAD/FMN-containing dehydrogenase